jgi:hypothetical protein
MYDKSKGLLTSWRLAQTVKVPALTWRDETVKVEAIKVWMLKTVSMPVVRIENVERTRNAWNYLSGDCLFVARRWHHVCRATEHLDRLARQAQPAAAKGKANDTVAQKQNACL